ncbi:MAG: DUF2075 domain-containing protein [Fibromonadaceae bacterium]|jgi:chromosomal replication initiation ATPase DnaA|nr:DUF2075 domain-containing protein [Fibromonadaceae bacterium]
MTQFDIELEQYYCVVPIQRERTFANFIAKESEVYKIAQNFWKKNNRSIFVIKGEAGSGKAHVLHAIGNKVRDANSDANVVFLQCDLANVEQLDKILAKTRNIDLLLLNKFESVLEKTKEFQKKIAQLLDLLFKGHNKPIVIASSLRITSMQSELDTELWDILGNRASKEISTPSDDDRKNFLQEMIRKENIFITITAENKFVEGTKNEKADALTGMVNDLIWMVNSGEEIDIEHIEKILENHKRNKVLFNTIKFLNKNLKYTFDYFPIHEESEYKYVLNIAKNINNAEPGL